MSILYNQNVIPVSCDMSKAFYTEIDPHISIVILNFNKAELTIKCLESLWANTHEFKYEIIVVDNGSRPEEFNILEGFKGAYQLLRLDINRYFGEGNNIGAELAKGEFLVFMNNDVMVKPGWLPPLLNAFSSYPDCGASGPKFLYPDGVLQEAGALIDVDGEAVQIGKFQDPCDPRFNLSRAVDYVSAATVMMRKTIFEEVLGFDFIYEPAYYEDVDLCLKIGKLGLKTYYIPESSVVHHENATTSDKSHGLQLNTIVESNRQKFVKRWSDFLSTGKHNLVQEKKLSTLLNFENKKFTKTAAIYTPYNINPGGGERYLLTLAEYLINNGYKTWLILPEIISSLRIKRIATIFNLNLSSLNITTYIAAEEMEQFNLFIAMGNEIVPPVKALGRSSFFLCQFPFPISIESLKIRSEWMEFYKTVIVYSDFAKYNVIKQISNFSLPKLKVEVASPAVDMQIYDTSKLRKNIISVGRFFVGGHCKQQDMMINVLRKINELGVDIQLHLVGSLPPEATHRAYLFECQRLAQGLPVHFHVDASEDTLSALYEESSIYWHAGGFNVNTEESPEKCEHFGISVVEAMSAGIIPVVVNNGGPSFIVEHGINGFCYETEEELIEYTLMILSEEERRILEIRESARRRAHNFTKDIFFTNLDKFLHN